MTDYRELHVACDNKAREMVIDDGRNTITSMLLREAAAALRVQAERIAELERQVADIGQCPDYLVTRHGRRRCVLMRGHGEPCQYAD